MINLSRKLVNNKNLLDSLIKSFTINSLSNSIIFSGSKGIGKTTLSFILVSRIYNLLTDNNKLSNIIYGNSHPNIRYIYKLKDDKTDKLKNFISIDQIRGLENFLNQSSFDNQPKFIILDSADDLNINSSNALLKVLEEPKKNTFFILIAHQLSNIIPTIRSRCIKFNINKPNFEEFKIILKSNDTEIDDENIDFLYKLSGSSPGLALELHSDKISFMYISILNILDNHENPLSFEITELSDILSDYSNDEFRIFLILFRYILMAIIKINLGVDNDEGMQSNLLNKLIHTASKIYK